MYILIGIFILLCAVCVCLRFYRRKCIIRRVRQMDDCQKAGMLNDILMPLGFCYLEKQDVITSTQDAWQRQFGYCTLFDRTAVHFGMVFDCEPVYFYYHSRTYRIEFWKGQYGVNAGAEVGIYYAEGIIPPQKFDSVSFQSVSDEDMLVLEMALYYKGRKLFENTGRHWWLTGFAAGNYCEPEDLVLRTAITFRDQNMAACFVKSLQHMGYQECDILICDLTVCFSFCIAHGCQPRLKKRCCAAWSQWKNRMLVRLFVWITKPFTCTLDRLIYLYFFLPSVFRRTCLCRRNRRQKLCRKRRRDFKCCKKTCRKKWETGGYGKKKCGTHRCEKETCEAPICGEEGCGRPICEKEACKPPKYEKEGCSGTQRCEREICETQRHAKKIYGNIRYEIEESREEVYGSIKYGGENDASEDTENNREDGAE